MAEREGPPLLYEGGRLIMPNGSKNGMASVFVEWSGNAATDKCGIPEMQLCSNLHRVFWCESFVASEGRRRICHFRAPDAESVRLAFRRTGVTVDKIWTGTVHDGFEAATADIVVERDFLPPFPTDAKNALEVVQTGWLEPHGLKLARAVVSFNRGRVICICESPGGRAVQPDAFEEHTPPGIVWSCRRIAAAI